MKFALKNGQESFILTYDQLDLDQFDYGVDVELYDLFDKANSPLFKKLIYLKIIFIVIYQMLQKQRLFFITLC